MTPPSADPHDPAPGSMRWCVPAALFISLAVAFLDRMNISFAIQDMARHYHWSVEEVGRNGGHLMSLFFVGYGLSNIFLSGFAGRFGPRRSLLTIIFLFSMFTMLGAPAAALSFTLFGATRFLLGVSEGVHFPMMTTLSKNWFPDSERSRANSLWVSGILLAQLSAPFVLVFIIQHWGWQTMLVLSGTLGLLVSWPVVWWFVHDSPAHSPRLSTAERQWLLARMPGGPDSSSDGDWAFLRSANFYLALSGAVLNNIFAMGFIMWLPTYFVEGRGMNPDDLRWAATLPYIFGLAGIAFLGWLGDRIGRRYGGRAALAGLGYLLAGTLALAATQTPSPALTVAVFALAAFCHAGYTSQEWALIQQILPTSSIAHGSGVYNGLGILIGGGFGQLVIGEVIARSGNYTAAIAAITLAALLGAAVMFTLALRLPRPIQSPKARHGEPV